MAPTAGPSASAKANASVKAVFGDDDVSLHPPFLPMWSTHGLSQELAATQQDVPSAPRQMRRLAGPSQSNITSAGGGPISAKKLKAGDSFLEELKRSPIADLPILPYC